MGHGSEYENETAFIWQAGGQYIVVWRCVPPCPHLVLILVLQAGPDKRKGYRYGWNLISAPRVPRNLSQDTGRQVSSTIYMSILIHVMNCLNYFIHENPKFEQEVACSIVWDR